MEKEEGKLWEKRCRDGENEVTETYTRVSHT